MRPIVCSADTLGGRLVLSAHDADVDPDCARELLWLALPLIWASAKTLLRGRFCRPDK